MTDERPRTTEDTTRGISLRLPFVKMFSGECDFVLFDARHRLATDLPQLARFACHRTYGVGASGAIFLEPSKSADFRMTLLDADGMSKYSAAAVRCLARFIYLLKAAPDGGRQFVLETERRLVNVEVIGKGERVRLRADTPELEGSKIPVAATGRQVGVGILVEGVNCEITAVGIGDSHCVVGVDDVRTIDIARLGSRIATHQFFPKGTHVDFVQYVDASLLKVRSWDGNREEVESNDDGIAAAVVAGVLEGRCDRSVLVECGGQEWKVIWQQDGSLTLAGPTELICQGELNLETLIKLVAKKT